MDTDDLDVYPIWHKDRVYHIVTAIDMTFREVHAVIDLLVASGAFHGGPVEQEPGMPYSCPVEGAVFVVDVQGNDVVVLRKDPAA